MKALVLYIATIVAANYATSTYGLVAILGLTVTAGTYFAGAALIARDFIQRDLGKPVVLAAIGAGALLSAVTSSPALAVASGLAFLTSELVDLAVYTPLSRRNLAAAILASSIVSAPVDTILFLHLAGFPVTPGAVAGQFAVKTALAALAALGMTWRSTSQAA